MMKISKPVLMNDLMVNHVQFISLNLVSFKNVKPVYDGNEKILLEYEYPSKLKLSSRDWIGIFPRGWSNLQQYVTFEWISLSKPTNPEQCKENGEAVKRTIAFCPKYHMNCVNQSAFYQFVYVGKQIEVLGVSSYFRFDLSCLNDSSLEIKCLVPVTRKLRSTSVSDFGAVSMTNKPSSTSLDSRNLMHTSSIHSLQNTDIDGKLNWSGMNFTDDKKNMCFMNKTTTFQTGMGDNLDPYSSHSEPVFPMSVTQTQCKKCHQFRRGGDILRSQQALQSKVGPGLEEASGCIHHRKSVGNPYSLEYKLKIVMERNKVLEERAQEMKKGLERLQCESKRLKMSYYNVNKEKVAYEKFVKDFIKSLEKDSIVRVMYGNTEILVKKVNYVGMEEHPRDKKTSKRERELKAVIGLQEITIRNLINSLHEKAKSVEELNQTMKLAQVFSAARTDAGESELETEETSDELSNSDINSEYDFSLAKPSPPEKVSADADDVLDSIRRTSEIELKNIGISRSLENNSEVDLDVRNLSVMTYNESSVSKKTQLIEGEDDCWPFPREPTKTLRQKLRDDDINLKDKSIESNLTGENENFINDDNLRIDEGQDGLDADLTLCEDYYDACDTLSIRNHSPEPETLAEDGNENDCECNNGNECLPKAVVPQETEDTQQNNIEDSVAICKDNRIKYTPEEKFNKFSCQLSIDFVHRTCQQNKIRGRMICGQVQSKSLQNLVAMNSPEGYSLERENSLITFKRSSNGFEIKITKSENLPRTLSQKMILEFGGYKIYDEPKPALTEGDNQPSMEESELVPNRKQSLDSGINKFKSDPPIEDLPEEVDKEEEFVPKEKSEEVMSEVAENENTLIDVFSSRTEWSDAKEILEDENREEIEETPKPDEEEIRNGEASDEDTETKTSVTRPEENESQMVEQYLKSKCNIQMLTEENVNKLKIYQDSLRYEKNLQFLNSKFEADCKEDDSVKETPSAILIQSGQSKVALIRYQ